jgi:hypothetical protein
LVLPPPETARARAGRGLRCRLAASARATGRSECGCAPRGPGPELPAAPALRSGWLWRRGDAGGRSRVTGLAGREDPSRLRSLPSRSPSGGWGASGSRRRARTAGRGPCPLALRGAVQGCAVRSAQACQRNGAAKSCEELHSDVHRQRAGRQGSPPRLSIMRETCERAGAGRQNSWAR